MRGEILGFDAGVGVIAGVDGARYCFSLSNLAGAEVSAGQTVDFDSGGDGQAQNITVVRTMRTGAGQVDLGRVIERTFKSIGRNWAVYFGAAAIMIGLPSLVMTWGQANMAAFATEGAAAIGPVISAFAIGSLLLIVGYFLLQAMVLKAAVNGFNGKSTPFTGVFGAGLKKALPLFGMAIVTGLALIIGFVLLIVPGVILCILWAVAAPVLVAENRGVFGSMQRSADLTKGHRWVVFGLIVIYVILSWIIGIAITVVGYAAGGILTGTVNAPVMMVVNAIANILSSIVGSAGAASLYFELRSAKEGVIAEDLLSVFD